MQEAQDAKKVIAKMVMANGFIQIKQLMKVNGLIQKKNGQGVETWPNGYIYKGEFKNSVWSGMGTLTFPDGSTYQGEWVNGFMNGEGTFTWANGEQKKGIWQNGKLQD